MHRSKSCTSYLQWWVNSVDEHGLPELPLQSCGQNEVSLPFQAQGIAAPGELRAGCLHQMGKVLEKMHGNDFKAMSSETEERYFPNPR